MKSFKSSLELKKYLVKILISAGYNPSEISRLINISRSAIYGIIDNKIDK